jgi:hypothetical protein
MRLRKMSVTVVWMLISRFPEERKLCLEAWNWGRLARALEEDILCWNKHCTVQYALALEQKY